jgi:class 3 adenylate cyclase
MKRALLGTLWIGIVATGTAIGLQLSALLVRPNFWVAKTLGLPTPDFVSFGNLIFVIFLGFFTGWTMLVVEGFWRRAGVYLLLLGELIGAAWLLHRVGVNFAPLPSIIAITLATILAVGSSVTRSARQRRATLRLFLPRLGPATYQRLAKSEPLKLSQPLLREASFVFCEIANEADLIEELQAGESAALTGEFIDLASKHFLSAGAYLHAADGEGIRVLFGFPEESDRHAVEAARAGLGFRDHFRSAAADKPDSLGKIDLRIGISSGAVVATVRGEGSAREIVLAGEPFEIGRRLARANQIYGSEILLGPRTFAAGGKEILARPMDFLRNPEAHDRLEIYELLALTENANREKIARRDEFWRGVVYFRERRWNESFAAFHRARPDDAEADRPVEWYLRRLEPLCLRAATEPIPVAEPLGPLR